MSNDEITLKILNDSIRGHEARDLASFIYIECQEPLKTLDPISEKRANYTKSLNGYLIVFMNNKTGIARYQSLLGIISTMPTDLKNLYDTGNVCTGDIGTTNKVGELEVTLSNHILDDKLDALKDSILDGYKYKSRFNMLVKYRGE